MTSNDATENSPALQRWVTCMFVCVSPVEDERAVLPSLPGLGALGLLNPSVKTLGYFHRKRGASTIS